MIQNGDPKYLDNIYRLLSELMPSSVFIDRIADDLAAATTGFYRGLRDRRIPEEVATRLTEIFVQGISKRDDRAG